MLFRATQAQSLLRRVSLLPNRNSYPQKVFRLYTTDSTPIWLKTHKSSPQSGAEIPSSLSARQRKIIFRCKQRGWLELDVILGSWAAEYVPKMHKEEELKQVERILEAETPHLYQWIIGNGKPHPDFDNEAFESIRQFVARK